MLDLKPISALELLQLNAATIRSELKRRGVIRTKNKPTGDYAEYLFCTAFGWSQQGNSNKSHDAVSADGTTYQIKARHFSGKKSSRQLGAFRSFDFDYLAAVLFREDYSVERAIIIPVASIKGKTRRSAHTNSDLLFLEDHIWNWPGIQDVTETLRQAQSETKP